MEKGQINICGLFIKMATYVSIRDVGDRRTVTAIDDARLNKIAIANIAKNEAEYEPVWRQHQEEAYTNAVKVSPDDSLAQVINEEDEPRSRVADRGDLENQIIAISSPQIAQYVMDRLGDDDVAAITPVWKGFIRDVRKKYSKLNKDILVRLIKTTAERQGASLNGVDTELTPMGQKRNEDQAFVAEQMLASQASARASFVEEQEQKSASANTATAKMNRRVRSIELESNLNKKRSELRETPRRRNLNDEINDEEEPTPRVNRLPERTPEPERKGKIGNETPESIKKLIGDFAQQRSDLRREFAAETPELHRNVIENKMISLGKEKQISLLDEQQGQEEAGPSIRPSFESNLNPFAGKEDATAEAAGGGGGKSAKKKGTQPEALRKYQEQRKALKEAKKEEKEAKSYENITIRTPVRPNSSKKIPQIQEILNFHQ